MDDADHASEREEQHRLAALAVRKQEGPTATGYCLCCGEPLEDGRRWCDAFCRNGWERVKASREAR